jgi:hypothetical protein
MAEIARKLFYTLKGEIMSLIMLFHKTLLDVVHKKIFETANMKIKEIWKICNLRFCVL